MYGMLWPKPTGQVELSNELIHLLPGDISIAARLSSADKDSQEDEEDPSPLSEPEAVAMVEELRAIFKEYLYMMHPKYAKGSGKNPFPSAQSANASINVFLNIADGGNATRPTMQAQESYKLNIQAGDHVYPAIAFSL